MMHHDSAEDTPGDERTRHDVRRGRHARGLNPQAQKRLGVHLRAMYEQIVQQPIPDRFTDLIARLEHRSTDIIDDT